MKRKNEEIGRLSRPLRLAASIVGFAFISALTMLSAQFALLESVDARMTPEDLLLSPRYEKAQSFIILHEEAVSEGRGTLYLVEWHNAEALPCLGLIWIAAADDPSGPFRVGLANAQCIAEPYSIDQYWGMRTWPRVTFSVAYGYSGDADHVAVIWQDDSVTQLRPVNGSYLAVNSAKSRVIESVAFYDRSGGLLHRFPDSAGSWRIAS